MVALLVIGRVAGPCRDRAGQDPTSARGGVGPLAGPAAPSTTISPEQEVEAAYLAFWDMFVRLAQAPDPDDPEIRQRASGQVAGNLIDGLTTMRSLARRSELGPHYRHDVLHVEVRGETATVQDCAVDDSRVVETTSGEIVTDGVVTELLEATLRRAGDDWLVDSSSRVEAWRGAVACT